MTHDNCLTKNDTKVTKSAKNANNLEKVPKSSEMCQKKAGFHSIAATIRTRRESQCLLYAGFSL